MTKRNQYYRWFPDLLYENQSMRDVAVKQVELCQKDIQNILSL